MGGGTQQAVRRRTVGSFNGYLVKLTFQETDRGQLLCSLHHLALADFSRSRIASYINNLHPKHHRELYRVIEDVIAETIPLWSLTLAPLKQRSIYHLPRRIDYKKCEYDPDPEGTGEYPRRIDGEADADFYDRGEQWWDWVQQTRRVVLPDAPEQFTPLEEPEAWDLKKDLGKRPLQVIVKLANIELSPEKPEYGGGTWHVEGQLVSILEPFFYQAISLTRMTERSHLRNSHILLLVREHHHVPPGFSPAIP